MRERMRERAHAASWAILLTAALMFPVAGSAIGGLSGSTSDANVAVGAQYDSTHVYVAPADLDAFVKSFAATFGGQPSKKIVTNVLPVPSSTEFQYLWTPAGTLSVFAFETPIPYPFGQERTGYLVTDMDAAIKAARASGAEVIVEPFKDPIGIDAVIQWPGGVKMQLYWHFTPPKYPPLETIPDNRLYVSRDRADEFVNDFLRFSRGKLLSDDKAADAGEIGRAGETYRRIRIASAFGNMQVLVTDGHLPYPFGHELTGYEVHDLGATLEKAKAAGVKILSAPYKMPGRTSAILEFPGGYIAEVHAATAH
jgi:predicted enzyme related to lactoylglutathione lyase